jgi:hypothetical protein
MENKKTIKLEETSAGLPKETKEVEYRDDSNGQIKKETLPNWRRIVIELDGNNIKVVEAQVAGRLEMLSVLRELIKAYETK